MYKTSEIIAEYGITESRLKEYIIQQNIPLVNEEEISKKYFQTILKTIFLESVFPEEINKKDQNEKY